MEAQGTPYQKLKTHRIWPAIFLGAAQNHEQDKKSKNKNNQKCQICGPIPDLREAQFVLEGHQKHERTHPGDEWATKGLGECSEILRWSTFSSVSRFNASSWFGYLQNMKREPTERAPLGPRAPSRHRALTTLKRGPLVS